MKIPSHPELAECIRAEASEPGGISFERFMELALYHPEWGYYASGRARTGRTGDFFTSVSVGSLFGFLLARRVDTWWRESGCPCEWLLAEQGAHDGRLMMDIVGALPADCLAGMRLLLIEPSPALRALQARTLGRLAEVTCWQESLEASAPPAIPVCFYANELLDAFPVARVVRRQGEWFSLNVVATADGLLDWQAAALPEEARPLLPCEPDGLPEGFVTEICPALAGWARALGGFIRNGMVLLVDYGFEEADYFHPSRADGTLRVYHQHRATDEPFLGLGNCDITSHLNWSAVSRRLESAGFVLAPLVSQGRWLTRQAAGWLLEMEESPDVEMPKRLRQFQTLTHPEYLGGKFQILEALK